MRELLTQYGDIGLIWLDTPMSMTEQSKRVFDTVRPSARVHRQWPHRQPDRRYMSTGDNFLPALPFGGLGGAATLNDTWALKRTTSKIPSTLVDIFTRINSRGGNYLLASAGPIRRHPPAQHRYPENIRAVCQSPC